MKVVPTQGPVIQPTFGAGSQTSSDARARAIAMVSGQTPPVNQSQVAPEEQAAVKATPQPQADVQTPAPVEPPPAKEEPQVTSKFEELAKREKQLRANQIRQEQSIKAREEAIAKREAELEAKAKTYETEYIPKERLKKNALGTLTENGLDYDAITQQYLDSQNPADQRLLSHIEKLEAKLQALEGKTTQQEEAAKVAQQQQYDAAVRQIASDTKALVESDPSFELIKVTNSVSDVVELIERQFNEDGTLLSVQEAAQLVEEELLEQETKRLERISKLEKVQKRMQPVAPGQTATETKQSPAQGQQQQTVKTLTNGIGSTRQLSNRERAIMAFKGEKPS